jgi:hypothetical protein
MSREITSATPLDSLPAHLLLRMKVMINSRIEMSIQHERSRTPCPRYFIQYSSMRRSQPGAPSHLIPSIPIPSHPIPPHPIPSHPSQEPSISLEENPVGAPGLSYGARPHLTGRRGSCRPAVSTGKAQKDRPSSIMPPRRLRPGREAGRSLRPRASGHQGIAKRLQHGGKPMGGSSWLWHSPRRLKGEHGAERLDLVVSTPSLSSHAAKPERTGALDRARPRGEERCKPLGCEKAALRGALAAHAANHAGESAPQHSKHHGGVGGSGQP